MDDEPTKFDLEATGGRGRLALIVVAVVVGVVVLAVAALLLIRSRVKTGSEFDGQPQQFETVGETNSPAGQPTSPAAAAPTSPFSTYEQSGGSLPPRLDPLPEPGPSLPAGLDRLMTDDEKKTYGFPVDWKVKITTPKSGDAVPSFEIISGPSPAAETGGGTKPPVKPAL